MPNWTTRDTVKKHLQLISNTPQNIANEEIVCIGITPTLLANKSVSNVEVKTINSLAAVADSGVTLSGVNWRALDHSEIVPGSVVVASNQSLSGFYLEGVDFIIAYDTGYIRRCSGGAIADGQTVYPYYLFFTVLTVATDYTLDTGLGAITRVPGGAIEESEFLFVDYSTSAGTVDDNLIDQCILEVEDDILSRLLDTYTGSSTDQGLKTGATWLSLAAICRDMGTKALTANNTDEADGAVSSWIALSKIYELRAWDVLSRFLSSKAKRSPTLQTSGV